MSFQEMFWVTVTDRNGTVIGVTSVSLTLPPHLTNEEITESVLLLACP